MDHPRVHLPPLPRDPHTGNSTSYITRGGWTTPTWKIVVKFILDLFQRSVGGEQKRFLKPPPGRLYNKCCIIWKGIAANMRKITRFHSIVFVVRSAKWMHPPPGKTNMELKNWWFCRCVCVCVHFQGVCFSRSWRSFWGIELNKRLEGSVEIRRHLDHSKATRAWDIFSNVWDWYIYRPLPHVHVSPSSVLDQPWFYYTHQHLPYVQLCTLLVGSKTKWGE